MGRRPTGNEPTDRGLVQDITGRDLGLCNLQPLLRLGVAQELQSRLDGLQVFGGNEHDILTPVLGDLDPLMGRRHLLGDLRQTDLDLGKWQRRHRPWL
jgi:hypothetical protein